MDFVVIVKTVADLEKPEPTQVGFPPNYPIECREFDSFEEAYDSCPGYEILTAEEYEKFHQSLMNDFKLAEIKPDIPWWKVWKIFKRSK